jgi:hypothetical protein
MCRINYAQLSFDHVVVFSREDTLFATARENGSGKLRIFLIFSNGTDRAYTRNGAISTWERLTEDDTRTVIGCIQMAVANGIMVYKINGSSQAVVGHRISVN